MVQTTDLIFSTAVDAVGFLKKKTQGLDYNGTLMKGTIDRSSTNLKTVSKDLLT